MGEKEKPKKSAPKICSECGADVSGIDVLAHRDGHWGSIAPDPRLFPEAAKRYDALTRLAG